MDDLTGILVDNLKETFKTIERFLLFGLTAAVVLIVLAITDRELSGTQRVMLADLNAPAVLVAIAALGTYFAAGAFAAFYFATRRRIVKQLVNREPRVVEALLTYPSIVARIGAAQIVALAFVGGLGMVALFLFYAPSHETQDVLLTSVVIGSPYLALVAMAFATAIEERSRGSQRK